MTLVCNVCEQKATMRINIDLGRFNHIFYYCDNHKPISFELKEMDEKQNSDGKIIKQELFALESLSENHSPNKKREKGISCQKPLPLGSPNQIKKR